MKSRALILVFMVTSLSFGATVPDAPSSPQLRSIQNPSDPIELEVLEFDDLWFFLMRRAAATGMPGGTPTYWAYGPFATKAAAETFWNQSSQRAGAAGYALIAFHQVTLDGGGSSGGDGGSTGGPGGKGP